MKFFLLNTFAGEALFIHCIALEHGKFGRQTNLLYGAPPGEEEKAVKSMGTDYQVLTDKTIVPVVQ